MEAGNSSRSSSCQRPWLQLAMSWRGRAARRALEGMESELGRSGAPPHRRRGTGEMANTAQRQGRMVLLHECHDGIPLSMWRVMKWPAWDAILGQLRANSANEP